VNSFRYSVLALLLFPTTLLAGPTSVTAKLGTLGAGLEVTHYFTPVLSGRLGLNKFSYDFSQADDGIDYDYELDLSTVSALLDWHPAEGSFYLSAGIFNNANELSSVAKPAGSYTIGNTTYPAATVGKLRGQVDFDNPAGYLGIGWGNAYDHTAGLGWAFDLGVLFQGSPEVQLTADSPLAGDPAFQADLAREEKELEDELSNYEYYPVVSFGISYQF